MNLSGAQKRIKKRIQAAVSKNFITRLFIAFLVVSSIPTVFGIAGSSLFFIRAVFLPHLRNALQAWVTQPLLFVVLNSMIFAILVPSGLFDTKCECMDSSFKQSGDEKTQIISSASSSSSSEEDLASGSSEPADQILVSESEGAIVEYDFGEKSYPPTRSKSTPNLASAMGDRKHSHRKNRRVRSSSESNLDVEIQESIAEEEQIIAYHPQTESEKHFELAEDASKIRRVKKNTGKRVQKQKVYSSSSSSSNLITVTVSNSENAENLINKYERDELTERIEAYIRRAKEQMRQQELEASRSSRYS